MEYSLELNENQIDMMEHILHEALEGIGTECVLLIDLAGNILIDLSSGRSNYDVYSLNSIVLFPCLLL